MEWTVYVLLILVGLGVISTGLPAAFVLIMMTTLGNDCRIAMRTIRRRGRTSIQEPHAH